ncbi:MAG: carboxymuconolactone decarboxylase family protein [Rhodospirillales bacterium]|nr:carboxymuconolactone decarboxylase family protein [Rhodospirillales bacterium]
MARVPLLDGDEDPSMAELAEKIRSGRRGNVINVYKLLLHSPPVAENWFNLINTLRWGTELPGRLREIVIIRIGYLNRVDYVINQHVPKLALAEGLTQAECDALADWRESEYFSQAERAALAYAETMSRDVQVPEEIFAALGPHFNDREIVELTVLIGAYNMHTRVVQALDIDPEPKG